MVKKLDVQVRELAEPDFLEAASVWHESRKQVGTEMGFDSERAVTAEISVRVFREVIAVENLIWGAVQENCIVGILAINGSEIDRMYVRPGAQRCGIGTALLQKARELSPSGLELFTHEENRAARTFYEKHGFRPVRFGISPPPESEPDVLYRWTPDSRRSQEIALG
jgi:GNAT superfamily N-acetyltransferase